jgi:hypothetical protein
MKKRIKKKHLVGRCKQELAELDQELRGFQNRKTPKAEAGGFLSKKLLKRAVNAFPKKGQPYADEQ